MIFLDVIVIIIHSPHSCDQQKVVINNIKPFFILSLLIEHNQNAATYLKARIIGYSALRLLD